MSRPCVMSGGSSTILRFPSTTSVSLGSAPWLVLRCAFFNVEPNVLAKSGLAASRLVLSITEETLLTSAAGLVTELEATRRTGVRLCMDNYGMGHSIFALLARLPLDVVRVDVPALAGRDDIARARQVLTAIVNTTTDFDVVTIAGGVSTAEMLAVADTAGVALVHGRFLPHDLTVEAVGDLLDAVPTA